MSTLITIVHVSMCLFLMLTVLLQSGKGGGMGGAFGGGNTATVFGGSGASTFLRRLTAGAATLFMLTSMTLAYLASYHGGDSLAKFGNSQQEEADALKKAKEKALENAGSGSATAPLIPSMGSAGSTPPSTGSASAIPPSTPTGSAAAVETPPSPAGSATAVETAPSPAGSATGSAAGSGK
jgi:preprotein translocase subunit SecG